MFLLEIRLRKGTLALYINQRKLDNNIALPKKVKKFFNRNFLQCIPSMIHLSQAFKALIFLISTDLPRIINKSLSFIIKSAWGTRMKFSGTSSFMAMI